MTLKKKLTSLFRFTLLQWRGMKVWYEGNEVKRMCLNGVNCRETHQVKKKVKELQYAHRSFSVLINKFFYYVYECFGQYCMLI